MSSKKVTFLIIGISILFAAAIILSSFWLEGDAQQTVMFLLIAVWFVPFSILTSIGAKNKNNDAG